MANPYMCLRVNYRHWQRYGKFGALFDFGLTINHRITRKSLFVYYFKPYLNTKFDPCINGNENSHPQDCAKSEREL